MYMGDLVGHNPQALPNTGEETNTGRELGWCFTLSLPCPPPSPSHSAHSCSSSSQQRGKRKQLQQWYRSEWEILGNVVSAAVGGKGQAERDTFFCAAEDPWFWAAISTCVGGKMDIYPNGRKPLYATLALHTTATVLLYLVEMQLLQGRCMVQGKAGQRGLHRGQH